MQNTKYRKSGGLRRLATVRLRYLYKRLAHVLVDGAVFGVPVAIALFTGAMVVWNMFGAGVRELPEPQRIDIRVLKEASAHSALDPARAYAQLHTATAQPYVSTELSESAFWFAFDTPNDAPARLIDFPSRHGMALACWNARSGASLGQATRGGAQAPMVMGTSGFILPAAAVPPATPIVCRGYFKGPARLSVQSWASAAFAKSVHRYNRTSGLIDGSGLMLALFLFGIAIVNREPLYAVLGGWLFGNLRIAANSAGMDFTWLGFVIPPDWLYGTRQVTYTLYYVLTALVFIGLFKHTLSTPGRKAIGRLLIWSCAPMLLAGVAAPYEVFLPVLWVLATMAIIAMTILILSSQHNEKVAWLFSIALIFTLSGSLAEAVAAATGWREVANIINNVSGAFVSSVLGAMAVAVHLRRMRTQQQTAEEVAREARQQAALSLIDPLTDAPNRRGFEHAWDKAMAHMRRFHLRYWVAVIDLDGFKPINDRYGHGVGDNVLSSVAETLQQMVRGTDTVARLGGDEFGLLIQAEHEQEAISLCQRVVAQLGVLTFKGVPSTVHIGASLGMSACTAADTLDTALHRADIQMYLNKRARKANQLTYARESIA